MRKYKRLAKNSNFLMKIFNFVLIMKILKNRLNAYFYNNTCV